ncbi:hypothetical protein HPB48_015273 [Haemaphysalis longicornis]|uniref:Vacuolar protein sorting-associated protein 26B n=1 Tax=Haemaphysalis longicornis TaxID=44386 RepID=A0A9J6FUK7_HAELO|nr:hypothetical protein HPB48_015273 [Haemaphysalis longicornis]
MLIPFFSNPELYYDRGNHHEFASLVKELARPGELMQNASYSFEFVNVEKPYESYTGSNVRLRYFLRVTIVRRLTDIVKELDMVVHTLSSYPEINSSIKMEVGIEDCLHIEFEYNKSKYHLKDVIVGKIYFLLVRIKIKHMEIAIIKRETTGSGPNIFNENETIAKYEIMDGAPVRGESIPIRLFLAGYDLTPTMKDINKKFLGPLLPQPGFGGRGGAPLLQAAGNKPSLLPQITYLAAGILNCRGTIMLLHWQSLAAMVQH